MNIQHVAISVAMKGSADAPRRASLDAQSCMSASSSSLFSELSWGSDCDEEIVARHLGMSGKSLQDYLEYKKKDDTSSLSTATTSRCADDFDSSSTDADTTAEKDQSINSGGIGRRLRRRASIRDSIVSLSGTVLESIRECDKSSDEEATHQSKGPSVTFVKFEPSPDDASVGYGSEDSLQFDELFGVVGADGDGNASTGIDNGASTRGDDETPNTSDAAVASREFNKSADTKGSRTSSTSSAKGSMSRSSSNGSSKSSKPDPPESPRVASNVKAMNGSTSSLHIDMMRQLLSTKETGVASSLDKPFEITDVFIPQDVADDVVSDMYELAAGRSEVDQGLPTSSTVPSHFSSNTDAGGTTPDSNTSSNNALPMSTLRRADSDGNIISGMINELKKKLTEVSTANASSISEPSNSTNKSAASDAASFLLNVVKDVKLELANINMQMDEYRMKQRHLYEENELLAKQKDHLENQLETMTNDCHELRSELKVAKDATRAERKKLQEASTIQTQLKAEIEAAQCRLAEASQSEQQANLTMMNMMHHKNNASTIEFFDFTPDIELLRGDEGTARTEDLTQDQVNSKRSLLSSIASNLGADGSSRAIQQNSNLPSIQVVDKTPSSAPERGLFRRFSNMFNNSSDEKDVAAPNNEEQQVAASLTNDNSTEISPGHGIDVHHSESGSMPSEAVAARPPIPRHLSTRRHSNEPLPSSKSAFPTEEGVKSPRRSSMGCAYSSKGTRNLLPPDDQNQDKGTISLNAAPRTRNLHKKADSTRSINTHNDVMEFMTNFGNASTSTFESGLGSIPEQQGES